MTVTNPYSGISTGWLSSLINAQLPASQPGAAPPSPQTSQFITTVQGDSGDDYTEGNSILGTLSALPPNLSAHTPFTWNVQRQVSKGNTPGLAIQGPFAPSALGEGSHNPNVSTLTQMTMAGAMSYLRQLAVEGQGKQDSAYNAIVYQLVAAGYLTPAQARYGSFTTEVANAFLRSAVDVWNINKDGGAGQLVTWNDHISSMIQARQASGQADANGLPGGGGGAQQPTAPTRTDVFTNPDDVKAAVNSAAESILGRKLNDSEIASFQSTFHGLEQTYNNQAFAQEMAKYQQNVSNSTTPNTAPPVTQPPSPTAEATNYMDNSPAFGQERTNQLLGSYIGVLRNSVGLGAGGVSRAVS